MPKPTQLPHHLPAGSKYVIECRGKKKGSNASPGGIAGWPLRDAGSSGLQNIIEQLEEGPACTSGTCLLVKLRQTTGNLHFGWADLRSPLIKSPKLRVRLNKRASSA